VIRRIGCATLLWLLATAAFGADFDHAGWTALLARHVAWNAAGTASTVDYGAFQRDREALKSYLDRLSTVDQKSFAALPLTDRRAFLINAYNAFTVELILSRYPNLHSIKELGGLLSSPWKKRFFTLLGEPRSLDDVEHRLLRGAPDFDDPRIHFAVNCASIGCPALRPEAYSGATLDAQLDDQANRFLRDRSRNRISAKADAVEVSAIFDWYEDDFAHAGGVGGFLADRGEALGASAAQQRALRAGELEIRALPYDWRLNAAMPRATP
jgi:hypothetical protein